MSDLLWTPTAPSIRDANLTKFSNYVRTAINGDSVLLYPHATGCEDYSTLHAWSIGYPQEFWAALWRFFDVIADERVGAYLDETGAVHYAQGDPWDSVLAGDKRMALPAPATGPIWFPGASLNFAEYVLRHCSAAGADTCEALVCYNASGERTSITFAGLYDAVMQARAALQALDVREGDLLATRGPQSIEATVVALAAASLGAIIYDTSHILEMDAVLERLGTVKPRVLFFQSNHAGQGAPHTTLEQICYVTRHLPFIEYAIALPGIDPATLTQSLPGALAWEKFLALRADGGWGYTRLPFSHPLMLADAAIARAPDDADCEQLYYSSGGLLLQQLKELSLHCDVKPGDRILYGSHRWQWPQVCLGLGATLILFDGNSLPEHPAQLWSIAECEKATHIRTTSFFIEQCERAGLKSAQSRDLSALRCVIILAGSSGSGDDDLPCTSCYEYLHRDLALASCLLFGLAGVASQCYLALGHACEPVIPSAGLLPALGMAVDTFNTEGGSSGPATGELVCTQPFPSMPLAFFDDPGHDRYIRAFFTGYPNVWRDGRQARITAAGRLVIDPA